jgi:ABC-type multidrug transport system ATPase subunit
MISIKGIYKRYGNTKALDNLSLEVEKGTMYGLIGPDGAGKTSLFRILSGLILPDKGKASINYIDCINDYKKTRKIMGYMPQRFSLYTDLTVYENLNFFATIYNTTIKKNYHLIKDVYKDLEPFKNRKAKNLSGGMKQKLALSCALIHKPDVLLLDEPTTGVDPVSRKEFWDILKKLKKEGLTTLVSTPFMNDAELCDEVALIQNGKLLAVNTPDNISNLLPHKLLSIVTDNNFNSIQLLKNQKGIISAVSFGKTIHITVEKDFKAENINNILLNGNINIKEIKEIPPGVEDVFMYLM